MFDFLSVLSDGADIHILQTAIWQCPLLATKDLNLQHTRKFKDNPECNCIVFFFQIIISSDGISTIVILSLSVNFENGELPAGCNEVKY